MKLEVGKKYLTRDNQVYEIIFVSEAEMQYPVVGISLQGGELYTDTFAKNGEWYSADEPHDMDLIHEI